MCVLQCFLWDKRPFADNKCTTDNFKGIFIAANKD